MKLKVFLLLALILILLGCSKEQTKVDVKEVSVETPVVAPPVEVKQEVPIEVKKFNITADDHLFLPYRIYLKKGDKVQINFNFNDSGIYDKGLQIKSDYFNVSYRKGSMQAKTVEFVADRSFSYSSYLLDTNIEKTSGKVEVS